MKIAKDHQKLLTTVLAVLVVVLLLYIAYSEVTNRIDQRVFTAAQQGYQQGTRDTLSAVFQETANCQVATMTIANQTKRIVDVSCLQQAQQPSQPVAE